MKPKNPTRSRLDVLRRFVSSLLAATGVKPDRAAAMATQLLWFDAAGFPDHGVATLPDLLDRIARSDIDPKAEGKVGPERAATAVLDGQHGLPALIIARAAAIATEKAREMGVGVVRVKGIGPAGPASAIVADVAIGPMVGIAMGPDGAWSVAMPSPEGTPLLADSLSGSEIPLSPWAPLTTAGEWLIQALAVTAMEPLSGFHQRVAEASRLADASPFRPEALDASRREAREHGVAITEATRSILKTWAGKLGVADL